MKWGKLRADVLALNTKLHFVLCEVKSCVSDFKTDKKWRQYLNYCNKFYFVFNTETWAQLKEVVSVEFKSLGVGVLVVSDLGRLTCALPSKGRKAVKGCKREIVIRMAWRGGDYSRATHTKSGRPRK